MKKNIIESSDVVIDIIKKEITNLNKDSIIVIHSMDEKELCGDDVTISRELYYEIEESKEWKRVEQEVLNGWGNPIYRSVLIEEDMLKEIETEISSREKYLLWDITIKVSDDLIYYYEM